ncbi:MAG: hypothetical protein IPG04_38180 [Polyangiaceae bacterium]|jgi:hypothetical protein|nr:hypothetical protein [Polyangiaceae bacterium]
MAVETVRVSEHLWQRAPASKRDEWSALAAEVRGSALFPSRTLRRVVIDAGERAVTLALFEGARAPEVIEIQRSALQVVLDEYASIIHRLEDEGPHTTRAEALDHAKKTVHDAGARKLAALEPALGASLDVYRKVFSLLVAIVLGGVEIDWAAAQ